jgi:hypothetical protein
MSDALEEIFEQTKIRVHKRTKRGKLGWAIPPNIERASVSRESTAIAKPAARLDDDEKGVQTMDTPGGPQETAIIFEPVTSYSELIGAIRVRIGELGVRYLDFDKLAGWAEGLSGKIFGAAQIKRLGPEKLFDAIRASGMRIRLEPDPEQLEKMRKQIAENCQPRQANQVRMGNRSHLSNKIIDEVLGYLANKKGGLARLNAAVRQARSNIVRRGNVTRRQMRECGTGDLAAYPGNVSRLNAPSLDHPANPCSAEANAA